MKKDIDIQWFVIVLILLVSIIGIGVYALVTHRDLALIGIVMTALILRLGTMLDFMYGSSKDKTDILSEENKG